MGIDNTNQNHVCVGPCNHRCMDIPRKRLALLVLLPLLLAGCGLAETTAAGAAGAASTAEEAKQARQTLDNVQQQLDAAQQAAAMSRADAEAASQ